MNLTKIVKTDLDSPRSGLRIVVALTFFPAIDFSRVSTGGPIQLYTKLVSG